MQRSIIIAAATVLLAVAAALPQRSIAAQPYLIDQRGHRFTLTDLERGPVVVTFVSAHCTDVCPLVNAMTAQAVRRVVQAGLRARFLTVTLDPQHDTLADLRRIAVKFHADPREWIVAGGSVENVERFMQAFGVSAHESTTYVDAHSTFFYIVGTDDRLRTTLMPSFDISDRILAALRRNGA